MSVLSPFHALVVIAVAVLTAWLLLCRSTVPQRGAHLLPIDGLRGFLALFVLLHHAGIWWFYLHEGRWAVPPSHLFTHFGQASVACFFMITAFLFSSRLLTARQGGFDFARFYVSRVLRLTPLYVLAVLLLLAIVGVLSAGRLNESWISLLWQLLRWFGFTLLGAPDVNGVVPTSLIIARVTWTLRYEWLFYLGLPLVACVLRLRVAPVWLLCGLVGVAGMFLMPAVTIYLAPFLGGILAALMQRQPRFTAFARSLPASGLIVLALVLTVCLYPSTYTWGALCLLTLAFCLIAGGNTLFGILLWPAFRLLGEISYSLYLLHGLCLFVLFQFVLGAGLVRTLSPAGYWSAITALTPCLVVLAFFTYRYVERPAMQCTDPLMKWLRTLNRAGLHPRAAADLQAGRVD